LLRLLVRSLRDAMSIIWSGSPYLVPVLIVVGIEIYISDGVATPFDLSSDIRLAALALVSFGAAPILIATLAVKACFIYYSNYKILLLTKISNRVLPRSKAYARGLLYCFLVFIINALFFCVGYAIASVLYALLDVSRVSNILIGLAFVVLFPVYYSVLSLSAFLMCLTGSFDLSRWSRKEIASKIYSFYFLRSLADVASLGILPIAVGYLGLPLFLDIVIVFLGSALLYSFFRITGVSFKVLLYLRDEH